LRGTNILWIMLGISLSIWPSNSPANTPSMNCQCSDPGCPVCHGHCNTKATDCLMRCDMDDRTGTPMCEQCASDALDSGLFRSEPWNLRFHRPPWTCKHGQMNLNLEMRLIAEISRRRTCLFALSALEHGAYLNR
jgi:hypothetical protein